MNFLNSAPYIQTFERFSTVHIGILVLTMFMCLFTFLFRNRVRYSGIGKWLALFFTFFALGLQVVYLVWSYANKTAWAMKLMPLDFAWLGMLLAMIVYVTKSKTVFNVFFFMSFYTIVNLIYADFGGFGVNHFRFYHFFITNMYVIWSCAYFVFVENMEIDFKSFLTYNAFMLVFFVVILVMHFAYGMNSIINIMNLIPQTLLDSFGVIGALGVFAALNAVVSFILYLPWAIRKKIKDREVEIYQ